MVRRSSGEGSVTKRSDGRWQASLQVNGKRKTVYGKNQKEVVSKLNALKQDLRIGAVGVFVDRHTLDELMKMWLETGAANWSPRTAADHRQYAEAILEEFGRATLLTKITAPRIQLYINQHRTTPRKAQLLRQALKSAFRLALSWGWVTSNPTDHVVQPRSNRPRRQWWTAEQCRTFLSATRSSRWWPLWAFALATGCRLGEMSALRWSSVDFDSGVVQIKRSGQHIGKTWVEKAPKSHAGLRTLLLNSLAREALDQQRQNQQKWREKAGSGWQSLDLVFSTLDGGPLHRHDVGDVLRQKVRTLGLPPLTVHGFRHLTASLALDNGAPLPMISKYLGHASVGITARVYSHAVGNGAVVGAAVEKALGNGNQTSTSLPI